MTTTRKTTEAQRTLTRLLRKSKRWSIEAMGQQAVLHLVEVDDTIALDVIEHCNVRNRKVRQRKVGEFAEYIKEGRWQLVGTMVFSDSGELIDGQHRMLAIAQAGVTVSCIVTVVPQKNASTVDRFVDGGTVRNIADFLNSRGVEDSYRVAPILVYERNARITGNPLQGVKGTKDDYLALYRDMLPAQFKKVFDVMPRALHKTLGVNRAFLDWFALHASFSDTSAAELFFGLLKEPAGLSDTDPCWVLRELLIDMQRKGVKTELVKQAHMVAKAWKLFALNQKATNSKVKHRIHEEWPGVEGEAV